jgi:hypothetical protein
MRVEGELWCLLFEAVSTALDDEIGERKEPIWGGIASFWRLVDSFLWISKASFLLAVIYNINLDIRLHFNFLHDFKLLKRDFA